MTITKSFGYIFILAMFMSCKEIPSNIESELTHQTNQSELNNLNTVGYNMTVCSTIDEPVYTYSTISVQDQASTFFATLLDTTGFPSRWQCGDWSPFHGWLYIFSDLTTWLAYFAIPCILLFFIYKRKQSVKYHKIIVYFILFILFCGITHLLDAIIFWAPVYKLSALVRSGTAIISTITVVSLIKTMPEVMRYKSPAETEKIVEQLTKVNLELKQEILLRKKADLKVQELNKDLAKKVEELEAFSYSVSHDLRTPLRAIHGFSRALIEDNREQLNDEGRDYLQRIEKGTIRMGQLIDDLLMLSKISKQELTIGETEISSIMNKLVNEIMTDASFSNYSFEIENGLIAHCDVRLLKIVLENLLNNAIKFSSKEKKPKILFGQDKQKAGQPFFIKDNGVGFDMQFSDKLFRAFQRLHIKKDFPGTGIGLAIVQRIINKHGGDIWAESYTGKGSTFYFTMNTKL